MNKQPSIKSRILLVIGTILILCSLLGAVVLFFLYDKIDNISPNGNGDYTVAVDDEGTEWPVVDWDYWLSVNSDIIGWVTVPSLGIDYPIVQAHVDNPNYYLNHDVYGTWNYMGCPYLDATCEEKGLKSYNSVIYAHNLGYGDTSMFAPFAWLSDYETAKDNSVILLQTPTWKDKLDIEATSVISGWSNLKRTEFINLADFTNYHLEQYDNSNVLLADRDLVEKRSHLYTFCTCSYNYWSNERTLVYAA